MFQGYSDETFEFFMAIGFNNNMDFFHANHDWYLRSVRNPSLQLAGALSDVIEEIDPDIDRRPNRVVSRINRDIRFSKDKSPYRDYLWLAFHRIGTEQASHASLFFDLSADAARCGLGFYSENKGVMDALRRKMQTEPEHTQRLFEDLSGKYDLYANTYKRMCIPEDLPESLKRVYPVKDFYFAKPIRDFSVIKSPRLADLLAESFRELADMYKMLSGLVPVEV